MYKIQSYNELVVTLDGLGFPDFYKENCRDLNYKIDFGTRKGTINFDTIRSAAEKYLYDSSGKYVVNIDRQLGSPDKLTSDELVLQCIEVFDWGGVQASNIIDAINYHRANTLKSSLIELQSWFEDDNSLAFDNQKLFWSSGWTKVFSFMFSKTTIYDSRVAAYINFLLVKFYNSLGTINDQQALKAVTSHMISFNGTVTRARRLDAKYRELLGIKMKSSNDRNSLQANKVASWFLRYLSELEYGDSQQFHFRQIDKAMFMLGFDMKLIDRNAPFD